MANDKGFQFMDCSVCRTDKPFRLCGNVVPTPQCVKPLHFFGVTPDRCHFACPYELEQLFQFRKPDAEGRCRKDEWSPDTVAESCKSQVELAVFTLCPMSFINNQQITAARGGRRGLVFKHVVRRDLNAVSLAAMDQPAVGADFFFEHGQMPLELLGPASRQHFARRIDANLHALAGHDPRDECADSGLSEPDVIGQKHTVAVVKTCKNFLYRLELPLQGGFSKVAAPIGIACGLIEEMQIFRVDQKVGHLNRPVPGVSSARQALRPRDLQKGCSSFDGYKNRATVGRPA